MTATVSDTSVVICTFKADRWDAFVASVESAKNQAPPPQEVIIVVDHNPQLLERIRKEFPDLVVVENKEPQGSSGSRNSGIAISKGKKVAFLDDDATAEPDWLDLLSRHCDEPNVLGAGGKVEPLWMGGKPAWFPEEFYWVIGASFRGMPETTAPVRNLYGGCMCYPKEILELIGGIRTDLGHAGKSVMGGGETVLGIRINQLQNGVLLYEPRARIHHLVPVERARWRYYFKRCYAEGRSKARIVRLAGAKDGLSWERTHTLKTLPRGVLRGIGDTIFQRDITGLSRAAAIILGLAATGSGYILETIRQFGERRKQADA